MLWWTALLTLSGICPKDAIVTTLAILKVLEHNHLVFFECKELSLLRSQIILRLLLRFLPKSSEPRLLAGLRRLMVHSHDLKIDFKLIQQAHTVLLQCSVVALVCKLTLWGLEFNFVINLINFV